MASVQDYVDMFPTLDRCLVEEMVSLELNPEQIFEKLSEMHSLASFQADMANATDDSPADHLERRRCILSAHCKSLCKFRQWDVARVH